MNDAQLLAFAPQGLLAGFALGFVVAALRQRSPWDAMAARAGGFVGARRQAWPWLP